MYNPFSLGHWRPVLHRQPPGIDDVALTFDDGPTPETTPKIIALLRDAGATGTFFLSGTRAEAYPDLVSDLVAGGHQLYAHGWEHIDLESCGRRRAIADMMRAEQALARHRPTPAPYLVRLPYNAGYNRTSMHRAMTRFHPDPRFAWWSVNTRDYALADGCLTHDELDARTRSIARQVAKLGSLPGSILLMHENPFGAKGRLARHVAETLLPPILASLTERGLRAGPIRLEASQPPHARFLFINKGKRNDLYPEPSPAPG